MHIGIDVAKAIAPRDGVANFSAWFVEALMRIDTPHEFTFYALTNDLDAEDVARAFPSRPPAFRIGEEPAHDSLDLFHALAWAVPLNCAAPVVFTCYDLTFLSHRDFHHATNTVYCMEGVLRAIEVGATFLAISEATADEIARELERDRDSIEVVYPAVDANLAPAPDPEESRRRLARDMGVSRPFLLNVGTFEPRKNQLGLVRAFEDLPVSVSSGVDLVLAGGSGWLNGDLDDYLRARPDLPVKRVGFVDREQLVDLYSTCLAFAYPSFAEGFGLPVLEAMTCGAPVITSATSSLPEVAGDAGILVDPRDTDALSSALARVLTEGPLRAELSRKGLERAGQFCWDRNARETLRIYERVARGR